METVEYTWCVCREYELRTAHVERLVEPNLVVTYIKEQHIPRVESTKATTTGVLKKVFLQTSKNSQENICTRVSFFNKVAGSDLQLY